MSHVYFLHAPSVNLVKIGRSADPERRFDELRLLSPVPLEVIGMLSGGSAEECSLHQKFAALRAHGEWFHATPALLEFARRETLIAFWVAASEEDREWFRDWIDTPEAKWRRSA